MTETQTPSQVTVVIVKATQTRAFAGVTGSAQLDGEIASFCREQWTATRAGYAPELSAEPPDEDALAVTRFRQALDDASGASFEEHTVALSGAVAVTAAASPPAGPIVGERRTVVLEFLGEAGAIGDDEDLPVLMARAEDDNLVGDIKSEHTEVLDGPSLARLARAARSTPDFFGLADDGRRLEADEDQHP